MGFSYFNPNPYGRVPFFTMYAEVLGAARILFRSSSMFFNGNCVSLIFWLSGIVIGPVPLTSLLYAIWIIFLTTRKSD